MTVLIARRAIDFDQPPRDLAAALSRAHLAADRFVTFKHGEMRVLSKGPRSAAPAENAYDH